MNDIKKEIRRKAKELVTQLVYSGTLTGSYKNKYHFIWYRKQNYAYNIESAYDIVTLLIETRLLTKTEQFTMPLIAEVQRQLIKSTLDCYEDGLHFLGHPPLHEHDADAVQLWMSSTLKKLADQ